MADKPLNPSSDSSIDSVLHEQRKFECPEEFRQRAHIQSLEEYERLFDDATAAGDSTARYAALTAIYDAVTASVPISSARGMVRRASTVSSPV